MKTLDYRFILQRVATLLSVAVLTLTLLAAVTGILLAFYYEPTAGQAHRSLKFIIESVPAGTIVLGVHNIAGTGVIVLALLQIIVLFLGRQFRKTWLTAWISGILLTLTLIGLSWTAMILGWDQLGYWRFKIEQSTIEAIPFIGNQLRDILTGGVGISSLTVQRMYTIHSYLLSLGAVALSILHLASLVLQQPQQPIAAQSPAQQESEAELEGSISVS